MLVYEAAGTQGFHVSSHETCIQHAAAIYHAIGLCGSVFGWVISVPIARATSGAQWLDATPTSRQLYWNLCGVVYRDLYECSRTKDLH